ncbi:MAG: NAD(P)-dependent oxidoreductase [Bacteroidales bacterium]|nr:NAD(P)-dependent oxidoreductase [Bacteroidales bacterium]MBP3254796.1 NAD(P)-dependent oxidoreductase [Bacteroidales bacterium]
MKRFLVTGASGFIGSTLVDMLLERNDCEVFAGIRATSSKKYLQDPRIKFIDLNYTDTDALKQQLKAENFDTVFHLAGLTKAKRPEDFFKVNFEFTKHLVDAINGLPVKLIYMSSFAAHGPAKSNPFVQARVSDVNEPNTHYGKSKLKAEQYINENCKNNYIILRPTGVYGPRETDYFVYFKTIKNHIDATLGTPKQRLTFIYGKDLCKACIAASESHITGKTYFVSDGNVYLDTEFSEITKKILNTWVISIRFPLWIVKGISSFLDWVGGIVGKQFTLNKDKYNILAARNWDCDVEDLKNDLAFTADYDLQRGCEQTIKWYKENKWL